MDNVGSWRRIRLVLAQRDQQVSPVSASSKRDDGRGLHVSRHSRDWYRPVCRSRQRSLTTNSRPHSLALRRRPQQRQYPMPNSSRVYVRRPLAGRFFEKVQMEPMSGCWLWVGATNRWGYGVFTVSRARSGQQAHRVSYELYGRSIPVGLVLDHKCGQRCCVNPDHLEPVTQKENIRRSLPNRKPCRTVPEYT